MLLPLLAREVVHLDAAAWPLLAPDWLVLTSAAATDALCAARARYPSARLAVVGEISAHAALLSGQVASVVGSGRGAAALLEALKCDPSFVAPSSRVLWLRGDRALPDLRVGLQGMGVELVEMVVYNTLLLRPESEQLQAALTNLSATIFASPSAVEAMATALDAQSLRTRADCGLCVALGASTLAALASAGFTNTIVASGPGHGDLVAAALRGCRKLQ